MICKYKVKLESNKVAFLQNFSFRNKKNRHENQNGFLACLKTYYFFEQQDFLAVVEQDFASFLSVQAFSVLAFFFSFSFSLKSTTVAEETINAINATIDNTFFMLFIFKLIFYIYFKNSNI